MAVCQNLALFQRVGNVPLVFGCISLGSKPTNKTSHRISTPRRKAPMKRIVDVTKHADGSSNAFPESASFENRIKAVCTHEFYDLEAIAVSKEIFENYKVQPVLEDEKLIAVHMAPLTCESTAPSQITEAYLFADGVSAFWSIADVELRKFATKIDRVLLQLPTSSHVRELVHCAYPFSIVKSEADQLQYEMIESDQHVLIHDSPQHRAPVSPPDTTTSVPITRLPNAILARFAVTHGLAVSVKLGVLEGLVNQIAESGTAPVPPLKVVTKRMQSGDVLLNRKQVLSLMGELGSIRHEVNLRTDILSPDTYWERDDLEKLYVSVMKHFAINRRIRIINEKIDYCEKILECIDNNLSHETTLRLEWLIVILIAVEVLFELENFADKKGLFSKED